MDSPRGGSHISKQRIRLGYNENRINVVEGTTSLTIVKGKGKVIPLQARCGPQGG